MKRVLVLAPHPDDEAIGCGGAVRLHADRGHQVTCVWLTSGELGLALPVAEARRVREAEAMTSASLLGIDRTHFLQLPDWSMGEDVPHAAAALRPLLEDIKPDVIYVPHEGEWHPDHAAALPVLRAALPPGTRPRVRAYEVWSPLTVHDEVVDTSTVHGTKLLAVRAHASQHTTYDYARAADGLAAYRGVMAGRVAHAEVFAQGRLEERAGDRQ